MSSVDTFGAEAGCCSLEAAREREREMEGGRWKEAKRRDNSGAGVDINLQIDKYVMLYTMHKYVRRHSACT